MSIGGDQNGLYTDYRDWLFEQFPGSLEKFGTGSSAATSTTNAYGGAGGGSGYIGGVTNGYMENGKRSGNGYAKITLISLS